MYYLTHTGSIVSVQIPAGYTKIRVWGAQGGYIDNPNFGRGSYCEIIYKTSGNTTLYAYVGAKGTCSVNQINPPIYGGGSNKIGKDGFKSCTGGESTFVLLSNDINNPLIVSGAGGGSGMYKIENFGGYGGPAAGNGNEGTRYFGSGATNTTFGQGGYYPGTSSYQICSAENGQKFKGGNACATALGSSGGGGSGYFGGGGGADVAGGGGGSSFALSKFPNTLLNGNQEFLSPNGTKETGHFGDGVIVFEKYYINDGKCMTFFCNAMALQYMRSIILMVLVDLNINS